jgi:hypothetical protein
MAEASMMEAASMDAPSTLPPPTKEIAGPGTEELRQTMREGQSLIDRFYDGGNRAKPEALDILVMVLDQIVRRMREQYSKRKRTVEECHAAMAVIDSQIAMIRPKQIELRKELAAKQKVADEMRGEIDFGTNTIKDAIATAQKTLHNAKVITRKCETRACLDKKQADKGYDKTGKPLPGASGPSCVLARSQRPRARLSPDAPACACTLPALATPTAHAPTAHAPTAHAPARAGREVNQRKNPNGPAARRAGDMLKDLQIK